MAVGTHQRGRLILAGWAEALLLEGRWQLSWHFKDWEAFIGRERVHTSCRRRASKGGITKVGAVWLLPLLCRLTLVCPPHLSRDSRKPSCPAAVPQPSHHRPSHSLWKRCADWSASLTRHWQLCFFVLAMPGTKPRPTKSSMQFPQLTAATLPRQSLWWRRSTGDPAGRQHLLYRPGAGVGAEVADALMVKLSVVTHRQGTLELFKSYSEIGTIYRG